MSDVEIAFPPFTIVVKIDIFTVKVFHHFALGFFPPELNTIKISTCGRKGACVWLTPRTNSCLQLRREYKRSSYVFIEGFPDHILEYWERTTAMDKFQGQRQMPNEDDFAF